MIDLLALSRPLESPVAVGGPDENRDGFMLPGLAVSRAGERGDAT
ncbi:hypothetical protein [Sphaerisporangium aureirubrum]|uniref:Uncharacterized protein n=1 Tax=Sphaerisporangium aureirubrum TaxID=1544736 RepID=A0ABW1NLA6_9ACTN